MKDRVDRQINAGRRTSGAIHGEFLQQEGENDKINRRAKKLFYDTPNFADRTVKKTVENDQRRTNKKFMYCLIKTDIFLPC